MPSKIYNFFFSIEQSGYWMTVCGVLAGITLFIMMHGSVSEIALIFHFSFAIMFWIFFYVWTRHMIRSLN